MTYTKLELNTVFGNGAWDEKLRQTLLLTPGETENHVVNLYPEIEYQTWEDFGGAIPGNTVPLRHALQDRQAGRCVQNLLWGKGPLVFPPACTGSNDNMGELVQL